MVLLSVAVSHRSRSRGDPTLAGANERQEVPYLRDLVHLVFSQVQGPSKGKFRLEKDLIG